MPVPHSPVYALRLTQTALRALVVINIVFGLLVLALLPLSFVWQAQLVANFQAKWSSVDGLVLLQRLRLLVLIGLPGFPIVHLMLQRLRAVVQSVVERDPFRAENSGRLRFIAWAMFAWQLLNLLFGGLARLWSPENARIEWSVSFAGWMSVLLLFVLAQVFEAGTRMRQDLEGTI
jgi:hypothetical protein